MLDSLLQRANKLSQVAVWIGGALLIFLEELNNRA